MSVLNILKRRKVKDIPYGETLWYDEGGFFDDGGWMVKLSQPDTLLQMPESNLSKFAFSFRANATRITVSAEAIDDSKCRVVIEKSQWNRKQHIEKSDLIKQLEEIMEKHSLYKWDGFREAHEYHQAICEHFFLRAVFEDGTTIDAAGSSLFPEGFWAPMREIFGLFDIRV